MADIAPALLSDVRKAFERNVERNLTLRRVNNRIRDGTATTKDAHLFAEELGEDIATVFKTLVLRGDRNGLFVCVIPGDHEVDLKAAARISANKKADLIAMKELLPTTGYIRGGCSPIGMKRPLPTYIHASCLEHERIYISAGIRGLQIAINPRDLIEYCKATVAELSQPMA